MTQLATLATIFFSTQKIKNLFRSRKRKSFNHIRILLIFNIFNKFVCDSLVKIYIVFFDTHEYNIKFLANIEIIEYVFVNETIAKIICERLKFRAIILSRLKHFNCFNENKIKFITHVIYSTFTIQNHSELIIFMFITKNKISLYNFKQVLNEQTRDHLEHEN